MNARRSRRRVAIAGGVLALVVAGWLLRYTVFLDFPAYVQGRRAEVGGRFLAAGGNTLDRIERGEIDERPPSTTSRRRCLRAGTA